MMTIKIIVNDKGNPPGKLADAELHFDRHAGELTPLAGLKLIGFAIWETRGGGRLNVTFPARQYSINSERRSFALLRPLGDNSRTTPGADGTERIRELIIEAWHAYVETHDATTV
jgi:hypothetical protein